MIAEYEKAVIPDAEVIHYQTSAKEVRDFLRYTPIGVFREEHNVEKFGKFMNVTPTGKGGRVEFYSGFVFKPTEEELAAELARERTMPEEAQMLKNAGVVSSSQDVSFGLISTGNGWDEARFALYISVEKKRRKAGQTKRTTKELIIPTQASSRYTEASSESSSKKTPKTEPQPVFTNGKSPNGSLKAFGELYHAQVSTAETNGQNGTLHKSDAMTHAKPEELLLEGILRDKAGWMLNLLKQRRKDEDEWHREMQENEEYAKERKKLEEKFKKYDERLRQISPNHK